MAGPITKALSGRKRTATDMVSRAFASMTPDEQNRLFDAMTRVAEHYVQRGPPIMEAACRAMERIANRGANPEAR